MWRREGSVVHGGAVGWMGGGDGDLSPLLIPCYRRASAAGSSGGGGRSLEEGLERACVAWSGWLKAVRALPPRQAHPGGRVGGGERTREWPSAGDSRNLIGTVHANFHFVSTRSSELVSPSATMLRAVTSRSLQAAALRSRAAAPVASALTRRHLSDGSHDDFKPKSKAYAESGDVHAQIAKDISEHKVVVFMKGVPEQPMCGFSNTVVQVLKAEGVDFKGFNVLADNELRQVRALTRTSLPCAHAVPTFAPPRSRSMAAGDQVVLELADDPPGLHWRRVHWRLRHHC